MNSVFLSRTVICWAGIVLFFRSLGTTRSLFTTLLYRCIRAQTHALRAELPQPLPVRNVLCFYRHSLGGERRVRFPRLRRQESPPRPLLQRRLRDHFHQGVSPLSNGSSYLKKPLARVGDGRRETEVGATSVYRPCPVPWYHAVRQCKDRFVRKMKTQTVLTFPGKVVCNCTHVLGGQTIKRAFVTAINFCTLVDPGPSVGRSVRRSVGLGRFSHLERGLYFFAP